jgi:hypothetical protein
MNESALGVGSLKRRIPAENRRLTRFFNPRLHPSSRIHADRAKPFCMNNIREALRIQFDAIEPTAGGYRLSNSSNPDQQSVWLSQEEWRELCRLAGWAG